MCQSVSLALSGHAHYESNTCALLHSRTHTGRKRKTTVYLCIYNMDVHGANENVAYERIISCAGARFRLVDRVHFTLCYLRDVDDDDGGGGGGDGNDDDQNIPYRHQDTEETD